MKSNPLDFRSSNLMAHQWVLDQYEYFDTIQDADCDGSYNYEMLECDFVDHVMDALGQHMPKFVGIYRQDEVLVGRFFGGGANGTQPPTARQGSGS
jgi:hypothetical protein